MQSTLLTEYDSGARIRAGRKSENAGRPGKAFFVWMGLAMVAAGSGFACNNAGDSQPALEALTAGAIAGIVVPAGDARERVFLQADLIARPAQAEAPGGEREFRSGRFDVVRLDSSDSAQIFGNAALEAEGGALLIFAQSKRGGALRALPGGVIVGFSEEVDESAVRAWAGAKGLNVRQRLSGNHYLVASPPNLECLRLTERLAGDPRVVSAAPNWLWLRRS